MSFRPPKGTYDLMAPRSQAWREVLAAWEDWSARYGYGLVATPVFESTDLFERGVGETTEVVTKQMYTFSDKGGRSVTLRPEGTAGVVRAYLDSGATGQWKGAYSGPFFRYERPQKGRSRQFWQVGVEHIGVAGPAADAEVIELGYRFLSDVGVAKMQILLNSVGDPECRPAYVEELRSHLRGLVDQLSDDAIRLIDTNPLRVLDSKADRAMLGGPPSMVDYLCDPCREHYEQVRQMLDRLGVPFTEDPGLVRGLDYYTRTAFEFIGTGLDAAQNAVGGGGRYDGLAEAIGGPPTPGVGFALGVDRIVLARDDDHGSGLDAYLVSEDGPVGALAVASLLRGEGLRVDFDAEGRSVKAQFRAARRLGAPVVLVYKGEGLPIDVQWEGDRVELPLDQVASTVRERR
jgi:histidyl-tRNA synthetase